MDDWYEITMSDPKLLAEYMDMVNEVSENGKPVRKCKQIYKEKNSWVKKDIYRKKMKRKFYSMNPGMDKKGIIPLRNLNCIWIDTDKATNGGLYNINPVNHIYLTPRGHYEQFRGSYERCTAGIVFGLGTKDRTVGALTNRRIRRIRINEDDSILKHSEYKKLLGPMGYDVL